MLMSMLKRVALALALPLTITACKSESPTPSASSAAATPADEPAASPRRSGKIDLPTLRRPRPDGSGAEGEGSPRGRRDWDPAMRDETKDGFEAMRKAREAKVDTDGDGKISEAERIKARHDRADQMRTRMDVNGDGKVTAEELGSNASGRFARRLGDGATLDTNKDGDISTNELDAALAARGERRGPRGRDDGSAAGE